MLPAYLLSPAALSEPMVLPAYLPDLRVMENAPPPAMAAVSPACVFQLPSIGSAHAAPVMMKVAARASLTFRNMIFLPLDIRQDAPPRRSAAYANVS